MSWSYWLPMIWVALVGFAVMMYVLLDGFDLGIGILYPFAQGKNERDTMMNTVAPIWDGNETWMVLGAAMLYGAFPLAYATLLPEFYMPIIVMLAALVFRGVAFEFRPKANKSKTFWTLAFFGGAIIASFSQGVILGSFVQGLQRSEDVSFLFDWLSPFSITTGFGVIVGYALLGATWLIRKTDGRIQAHMYRMAKWLLIIVAIFMAVVSVWTPMVDPAVTERWFSTPNIYYLAVLPLITLLLMVQLMNDLLRKKHAGRPFYLALGIFITGFLGLAVSVWPYIIPRTVTIWQAAAPLSSLEFYLWGAIILLPVLIAYSIYSYKIFSVKVKADEGYH